MRLWHQDLIHLLPRQQLLGQHRECCALRGKGWGKPHSTVNYVFDHPYSWLYAYHIKVMQEMSNRGYKVDTIWYDITYRGKILGNCNVQNIGGYGSIIYPEHNSKYLEECIDNLKSKGINLVV